MTVVQGALLGMCLWCMCYSCAAAFTITEPGIEEEDKIARAQQATRCGVTAWAFAVAYWLSRNL